MRAPTFGAGMLVLWILTAAAPLKADTLPQEACTALSAERDALLADGVKTDRDHGPEWAKANLAPERLQKIAKLIEMEEQLSFRCDIPVTARPLLAKPARNTEPEADRPATADRKAKAATEDAPPVKKKKKRRTADVPPEAPTEAGAGDSEAPSEAAVKPAAPDPTPKSAPPAAKPNPLPPAKSGQAN